MYMDNDVDRPELYGAAPIYHDPNNPVAVAETFEREMTLDPSTLDRSVVVRKDLGVMAQNRAADRAVALKGSRSAIEIPSFLLGKYDEPDTDHLSVEAMKENPSRHKFDTTVPIGKVKGREQGGVTIVSSLRKPRSMAFGDFARTAPQRGFTTRAVRSSHGPRVDRRTRSFEALPGFDPAMFEDCGPEGAEE